MPYDPTISISAALSGFHVRLLALETQQPDTRRTNDTVSYGFGALTRSGFGSVSLSSDVLGLTKTGREQPVSWEVQPATEGNSAHWTRTGRTPTPSTAGASAGLSSGTYSFPLIATFADDTTELCTLTINVLADIATLGDADSRTAWWTAHSALVAGKTVELAAGTVMTGQRALVQGWRPPTQTRLRPHAVNRVTGPAGWEFQGCINLIVDDFRASNTSAAPVLARFALTAFSGNPCDGLEFNRATFIGSAETFTGPTVAKYGWSIQAARNITINDSYFEKVSGGVAGAGSSAAGFADNIVFNRMMVRQYFDNGLITGHSSVQRWIMNDCIFVAPMRVDDALHVDGIQIHDFVTSDCYVEANRCMYIHAEGTSPIQGIFGGNASNLISGANAATIVINGCVYIGCAVSAANMIAGYNTIIKHFHSLLGGGTRIINAIIDPLFSAACFFNAGTGGAPSQHQLGQAAWTGTNTLDNIVLFGDLSDTVDNLTSTNVVEHNGRQYSSAEAPPGSANFGRVKVRPDYVGGNFHAVDPIDALEALPYESMSVGQIVAAVKNIVKPKLNGAYRNTNGTYKTALNPNGSWATDTPFAG